MLDAHRARVHETIEEWRQALTLVDRKIDFYDAWIRTGQRPPLVPVETPPRPARRARAPRAAQ